MLGYPFLHAVGDRGGERGKGGGGGGGGGVSGAQLGSLVWPLGFHHKGSMPGSSVWSLITHTTGPFVVACVPSTACCRACFKCSLCVTALKEQRRSVRAVCRSAAAKNTTWRESCGSKKIPFKALLNLI